MKNVGLAIIYGWHQPRDTVQVPFQTTIRNGLSDTFIFAEF